MRSTYFPTESLSRLKTALRRNSHLFQSFMLIPLCTKLEDHYTAKLHYDREPCFDRRTEPQLSFLIQYSLLSTEFVLTDYLQRIGDLSQKYPSVTLRSFWHFMKRGWAVTIWRLSALFNKTKDYIQTDCYRTRICRDIWLSCF